MGGLTADDTARRKRAAVELIAREGATLRKTALRFSICLEDAEDAYQRAMEILLLKAPDLRPRELARWTQTVVKHEALAIRANRERLLGGPAEGESEGEAVDLVALIPAPGDGPDVRTERQERVARSREALQALKPAELRALTLLAAGYSYAEIGEITGWTRTKINRSLAEGRERFRRIVAGSENGSRCTELAPLLSAFCDGEAGAEDAALVREHLRACAACRAAMRSYRTAPATVAALAPALPASRSLLERGQDLLAGLYSRLPGGGGAAESSVGQVAAAGGTRGAGMAALAKLLAVCAGTVGGAAACVATGVVPAPLGLAPDHQRAPKVEHASRRLLEQTESSAIEYQPAPEPPPQSKPERKHVEKQALAGGAEPAASEASAGAVEYAPAPAPPSSEGAKRLERQRQPGSSGHDRVGRLLCAYASTRRPGSAEGGIARERSRLLWPSSPAPRAPRRRRPPASRSREERTPGTPTGPSACAGATRPAPPPSTTASATSWARSWSRSGGSAGRRPKSTLCRSRPFPAPTSAEVWLERLRRRTGAGGRSEAALRRHPPGGGRTAARGGLGRPHRLPSGNPPHASSRDRAALRPARLCGLGRRCGRRRALRSLRPLQRQRDRPARRRQRLALDRRPAGGHQLRPRRRGLRRGDEIGDDRQRRDPQSTRRTRS